jgi:hypothetical protein
MAPKVFLSYRRNDSRHASGRLRDRLATAFGEENVFYDVDSIPSGRDFREAIRTAIQAADAVLVMIGPGFDIDRLNDQRDYVRIELLEAFRQKKIVVPVLIDTTLMPAPAAFPSPLRELAYINASPLRHDPDFHRDCERLIAALRDASNTGRPASYGARPAGNALGEAAQQKPITPQKDRVRATRLPSEAIPVAQPTSHEPYTATALMPPKVAAVLAGLAALTAVVFILMTSFNAVYWTSAQLTLVMTEVVVFWTLAAAVIAHLWPQTKEQPVALAGTVTAFVSATLSLGVGFAWWQLTQSQNASLLSLVTAIIAVASALAARSLVRASTTPSRNTKFERPLDLPYGRPVMPPRVAALLAGLAALTAVVFILMTSFNAVYWTSAQLTLVMTEVVVFWALAAAVIAHLWPQTKEQPVAVAGTVTAFVSATLSLGVGFAWWQLTQSQNASLLSLVTAIIAVASALAARSTVTASTTPVR